jgi:hypothetical protein
MLRVIRSHLTVPRAIAALALFLVAAGGVAYAASGSPFIGQHGNINTCVPARGGEVNVWKPGHKCSGGRVNLAFPTGGQTGQAGPAGTTGATGPTGPTNPAAVTVDGESLTQLLLKVPTPASGSSSVTLYSADGLTILANCASTGNASLIADGPASADSELTVSGYNDAASPGSFGSQTNALGPSSAVALGPANAGHASFSYANSAGQVITGEIGYQNAPAFATYAGCAFFGTATSG